MLRRYAEWRPVAIRRIPAEWIGVAAGLATAVVVWIIFGKPNYAVFLSFGFAARLVKGQIVESRMKDLRDDPEGGQFAVSLRLSREVSYGYDEGLIAFEAGWLVYSGRRCAFSIRREDVLDLTIRDRQNGFTFLGEAGVHSATFVSSAGGRFEAALRDWIRAENVPGEPVLPPTRPTEEARRLHRSWFAIGALLSTFLAFAAWIATKPSIKVIEFILAAALLPLALLYGFEGRKALYRIAHGLPDLKDQIASFLGIKPPRSAAAEAALPPTEKIRQL